MLEGKAVAIFVFFIYVLNCSNWKSLWMCTWL